VIAGGACVAFTPAEELLEAQSSVRTRVINIVGLTQINRLDNLFWYTLQKNYFLTLPNLFMLMHIA